MERISLGSDQYPENLQKIDRPPRAIYILGELRRTDVDAIAVVGSRSVSREGEEKAYEYAHFLASQGFTIVSGLARGVDTTAHEAALAAGGRTLAVLGSSLDIIYPSENKKLAERIIKQGALVSEFPPQTRPESQNFLQRNRLVAGLSKVILIIEGDRRSGTLNTASHAANQNKDVLVIPGSPATDYLIENGATAVNSPQEMLAHLWEVIGSIN